MRHFGIKIQKKILGRGHSPLLTPTDPSPLRRGTPPPQTTPPRRLRRLDLAPPPPFTNPGCALVNVVVKTFFRSRDRDVDKMNSSALESLDHGHEITTLRLVGLILWHSTVKQGCVCLTVLGDINV